MIKLTSLKIISISLLSIFVLSSCANDGFFKRGDARENPPDPKERVKKNLEEGRGFRINDAFKSSSGGVFDFASSNELWRASLDTIDFMPLASVNYSGGIIVTDWYSDGGSDESLKISIRFLTNEVRSDALDIKIFSRECTDTLANCSFSELGGNLSAELKKEILKKAALYKKEIDSKKPESTYTYPVVD